MHPSLASRRKFVGDPVAGIKFGQPKVGVLMDGDGAVAASLAGDQVQLSGWSVFKGLLRVARRYALAVWLNPDLQQMHGFILRRIEFAVLDSGAGGHVLHIPGTDHAAVAHRILVLQRAAEDVGDDFHVAMRMLSKTHARHYQVVIDDAQAAEARPLRIVIVREAESVITVKPPVFGVAPFVSFSYFHHESKVPQEPRTGERPCFLPQHNQGLCSTRHGTAPSPILRGRCGSGKRLSCCVEAACFATGAEPPNPRPGG